MSHQWLGFSEPDPHGTKLRALQQLLRRMLEHGFRQNIQAHWSSQMNGFHPVLTNIEPGTQILAEVFSMPGNLEKISEHSIVRLA